MKTSLELNVDRVLWPTDFSEAAEASLVHAVHWARAFEAELHLLYIDLPGSEPAAEREQTFPEDARVRAALEADPGELLERLESNARSSGLPRLKRAIRAGFQPVPPILDYLEEENIDLVVMSTHGRSGLGHLFLGSTAERLVRSAPCPVLTVRKDSQAMGSRNRILVPVDLSGVSASLLEAAREISAWTGAMVDVLHVLEPKSDWSIQLGGPRTWPTAEEVRSEASRRITELVDRAGIDPDRIEVVIDSGFTGEQILERVRTTRPDLVLIASHSHGLSRSLLGSTAERVIHRCEVPVLTLPRAMLVEEDPEENR